MTLQSRFSAISESAKPSIYSVHITVYTVFECVKEECKVKLEFELVPFAFFAGLKLLLFIAKG